jgi:hypothetical protein
VPRRRGRRSCCRNTCLVRSGLMWCAFNRKSVQVPR